MFLVIFLVFGLVGPFLVGASPYFGISEWIVYVYKKKMFLDFPLSFGWILAKSDGQMT